jgi:hypothetical protein
MAYEFDSEDESRRIATPGCGPNAALPTPLRITENDDGSVTELVNGTGHVTIKTRGGIDLPNVRRYRGTGVYPNTAWEPPSTPTNWKVGARMAPEFDASQQGGSRKAASADPYHFVLQFDSSEID